jgi:hypothetical protein
LKFQQRGTIAGKRAFIIIDRKLINAIYLYRRINKEHYDDDLVVGKHSFHAGLFSAFDGKETKIEKRNDDLHRENQRYNRWNDPAQYNNGIKISKSRVLPVQKRFDHEQKSCDK